MTKRKHIPKTAVGRGQSKIVKTNENRDTSRDGKPSWRFSTVDKSGPFSWPIGQNEELTIVTKLHAFDSMKWADIQGKQHHFLTANSLSKEAIQRLNEIELDDEIDNLFSLHLQGKPRVICIRHKDVALLLWFDPEHRVSPSKKKHT